MNSSANKLDNMHVAELFTPNHTLAWKYLEKLDCPWDALPMIKTYIQEIGKSLDSSEYLEHPGNVRIHKTANIAKSAYIGADVIIGANTEVRHCAYLRGPALIGENVVVGNSTEVKNAILFDNVQIPHYNYVGDSILGYKTHLGAGVITSNVKSDNSNVSVCSGEMRIETNLRKFGAILGDSVEVGCNAVLNPGTVIGALAVIYPLSMVRGYVPANSIYKKKGEVVEKR